MLPDKKVMCPYTGFKTTCFKGVTEHSCPKYIRITGADPNTGQDLDKYGCADSFVPVLLLENALQARQTGAAVESLRNVVADINGHVPPAPAMKLLN